VIFSEITEKDCLKKRYSHSKAKLWLVQPLQQQLSYCFL